MNRNTALRLRAIIALVATTCAAGAIVGLGTEAANATTTTSASSTESASQKSAENAVKQFTISHPAPSLPKAATAAQYRAFSKSLATYWKAVPWSDVYGQWGCSAADVSVDYHATAGTWGAAGAEMSAVTHCSDPTVTQSNMVGNVAPRTTLLASATRARPTAVSLALRGSGTCTTSGSGDYICVNMPSTGTLRGSENYIGIGDTTGHLRLGQVGAGRPCGFGSFIGNSATKTLGSGDYFVYDHSVSVDSQFSSRWYDPNFSGGVCGTY